MEKFKEMFIQVFKYLIICSIIYLIVRKYNSIVEEQKNAPVLIDNLHHGKKILLYQVHLFQEIYLKADIL